jgi:transcriptional regulator with XRE-family HTH domain
MMMDSLKTLRQRYALSRKELAARVGVGYQRVWAWETGLAQPRLRHILRLAAALGVTPEQILTVLGPDKAESAKVDAAGESQNVQPRTRTGKLVGPPRGDARILAILGDQWMSAEGVAARLKISESAAYRALWRGEARGLIEHRAGGGYRARGQRS